MMAGVLASGVLIFALSKAETVTIVNLVIWVVVFPALVTGLIALAAIRAIGERQENDETPPPPPPADLKREEPPAVQGALRFQGLLRLGAPRGPRCP